MKPIWNWLKNAKNRDILKMTAAGLAAVVAAAWAFLTFVVDHHPSASVTSGAGGLAAGHDISGSTIIVSPLPGNPTTPLPHAHTRTRAHAQERTVDKSKYTEELAHQIIERMIDGESVDGAREGQGAVRGPACRR